MAGTHVSRYLEPDDGPSVRHYPATGDSFGGTVDEAVFVEFGDVNLWGPPERMADMLDQALTRVQSIMDAREEG